MKREVDGLKYSISGMNAGDRMDRYIVSNMSPHRILDSRPCFPRGMLIDDHKPGLQYVIMML